jgi:hypothetical protein
MNNVKQFLDQAVEKIKADMDKTFKKYVEGKLPAQMVTDDTERYAILAGMGDFLEYEVVDGKLIATTKMPISIFWDGSKFNITKVLTGELKQ